jgi:EAL domain-containing protein (putative c-di-GMP-specific phosphodiesterase class I)
MPLSRKSLEAALRNKDFLLWYQPIYNARNHKKPELLGAEALLRLRSGGVLLPPAEFIGAVIAQGLALEVGYWVMRESFSQWRKWQLDGWLGRHGLSVNLFDQQFLDEDLSTTVGKELCRLRLHHSMISLELSEESVLSGQFAIDQINKVQGCGVTVVLDDLGTMNANWNILSKIEDLTSIKLDKSCVQGLVMKRGQDLLRRTIELSRDYNLHITAEGIETEEQANWLRLHGCNRHQGYLYSRPLSGELFGALVKQHGSTPRR